MANNFLFLIGAMDSLWFHQTILFPEPFSLYFSKNLKPHSESTITISPSSSLSLSSFAEDISMAVCPLPDQENSAISSPLTPLDDSKTEEEEEKVKKRPTRILSLSSSRSRSHSSSPTSTQKRKRNHRHSTSCSPLGGKVLQKSMSCRSLKDLELEEVKGFMDLGFIFKKENLNARMISVVPGLLRLGFSKTKQKIELNILAADELPKDNDHIEQEEEKGGIIRPYLSEAWLIKRPDSPLLNLPRVSAAADMKKHLKFWARTVASVVQQEC